MHLDPKKLIDIEDLVFPPDVDICNYDLPPTAAFNGYAAPYIESLLKQKAESNLAKQKKRNLQMGGANIQKDITRVFLGLYRVVFMYDNKEYSMWVTGDGANTFHNGMPEFKEKMLLNATIANRNKELEEKKRIYEKMPANKDEFNIGCVLTIFIITAVVFVVFDLGITGIIIEIICMLICVFTIIGVIADRKTSKENRAKFLQEELEPLKTELAQLMALSTTEDLQSSKTVQQFREQKKALRGIYENVSDDKKAFYY